MERHPIFIDWKMSILFKTIYRFNGIPIKSPMMFLEEIGKPILKFIWNIKGLWRAKTILRKKNKFGELTFPDFKSYYKATIIKTVCCWHKLWLIDNWNRLESVKINSCIYSQMIFDKCTKTIQWIKCRLFNK